MRLNRNPSAHPAAKCPSSWIKTATLKAARKTNIPRPLLELRTGLFVNGFCND